MLSEEMRRVAVDLVHNFSSYHGLPRLRPKKSQPTRGRGTPRKWIRRTPAMAAGITDHRWTMWELMEYQIDNQITIEGRCRIGDNQAIPKDVFPLGKIKL